MDHPMKSAPLIGTDGHSDFNIAQILFSEYDSHRPFSHTKISLGHFAALVMLADFGFFLTMFTIVRHSLPSLVRLPVSSEPIFLSLLLSIVALGVLYFAKCYRIETIGNFRILCTRFLFMLAVVLGAGLLKHDIECGSTLFPELYRALVSWGGIAIGLFLLMRYAIFTAFRYLAAQGHVSHNVVVVGASRAAEGFISKVRGAGLGVHVKAVFDEHPSAGVAQNIAGVPVKGGITELLRFVKYNPIDTVVIVASEWQTLSDLNALAVKLSVQPLRVRVLAPQLTGLRRVKDIAFGWCAPAGELPGIHLMAVIDRPIQGPASLLKFAMDFSVALFALMLFAPLMVICAIGIKMTSPGPIFFRQRRIGYSNAVFEVLKFRTMHEAHCNTGELTKRNDQRIFAFGQIMRKYSLDELPQLFNVLKGDMSLVGPRPHMRDAKAAGILYFEAVPNYAARHRVKPGITGLAQISGWRGPTETVEQIEKRVAHDLYYVENWSLALDIKILAKTIFVGFSGDNAF
jgi:Undecaprenyl-phosphate glucose phosphotransferase